VAADEDKLRSVNHELCQVWMQFFQKLIALIIVTVVSLFNI